MADLLGIVWPVQSGRLQIGMLAGFRSVRWPASNRNGGRLPLATVAGFASEYPAGLNRNPHLSSLGLSNCAENDVDLSVLPDLIDQHLKDIAASLGHRLKMLRGITARASVKLQPAAQGL